MALSYKGSHLIPLRTSRSHGAWQGLDILHCDSIGHIAWLQLLNSGQCRCGAPVWGHWVPISVPRQRWVEQPGRPGGKTESVLLQEKKIQSVHDKSQRGTRTYCQETHSWSLLPSFLTRLSSSLTPTFIFVIKVYRRPLPRRVDLTQPSNLRWAECRSESFLVKRLEHTLDRSPVYHWTQIDPGEIRVSNQPDVHVFRAIKPC